MGRVNCIAKKEMKKIELREVAKLERLGVV